VGDFETGRLSLEAYLRHTVFYESRTFDVVAFKDFMFAQSRPFEDALTVARTVASSGRYLMAVLSNESRELNDYRIGLFGMGTIFSAFFSSCYVGLRKPGDAIFRLALDVTQTHPAEAVLIDDREENIRAALAAGMQGIRHSADGVLRQELEAAGIPVAP
jgi:putative hydrolase of the HAD superfamily